MHQQSAWRRAGAVVFGLAVGLWALLPAANASAAPLAWSAPVGIDSGKRLDALDCPTTTLCVAGDAYGYILASTNPAGGAGAWSSNDADVGEAHDVDDFSCPSASLCVGVDYYGNVLISTDPAGGASAWHVKQLAGAPLAVGLVAVSCPTTSFCVAAEQEGSIFYSTNPAGEVWQSAGQISQYGLHENSLDCPSTALCLAGDYQGHLLTTTEPTGTPAAWTSSSISGGKSIASISCPSVAFCAATDSEGDVLTSTNPTGGAAAWTSAHVGGESFLSSISCPSTSMCVIASNGGDMLQSNDPTGGAATWVTTPNVDGGSGVNVVSCPTTAFCVAVTGHGNVLIGSGEAKPPRTLTVKKTGTGTGEVTSSPTGIDCGSTCNRLYQAGATVTLFAHPDPGSNFTGWSGGGCTGDGPCTVTLNSDTEVTAGFTAQAPEGGGSPPVPTPSPAPIVQPPLATPIPHRKALKCRKGFKKQRVHGKAKCVKKKS